MSPNVKKVKFRIVMLTFILLSLWVSMDTASLLSSSLLTWAPIQSSGKILSPTLEYVKGDRIYEANGTEVIWRGAGASYLFHTSDYQLAWENHLPEIQKMGLNTMRLAFAFPDSNINVEYGVPTSDVLDLGKLDWVINFLNQHNIKVILDLHNVNDMREDFGSAKITNDWVNLASHYRGNDRIVAYELFNEPDNATWAPSITTKIDVAKAYQNLTRQIRKVDPEHIVIWESQPFLPVLETVSQYFEPNIVFTNHRWWHKEDIRFKMWDVGNFSYVNLGYVVETREKLNVPFWLGEFGSYWPFNASNPEWLLTEQTLFRSEEQAVGWNLWMGRVNINSSWNEYLTLFPLKIYNANLTRNPWSFDMPRLTDHLITQHSVDKLEPYQIVMWANNDYVTLSPGLVIRVITTHKLQNGTFSIVKDQTITIQSQLTIQNIEGTLDYPGDWNTEIFPVRIA